MKVGLKIRAFREKANMSRLDLATASGLSLMSIRRYETDEREPTLGALSKIATALGCYVSDMLEPEHWRQIDMSDAFDSNMHSTASIPEDVRLFFTETFAALPQDCKEQVMAYARFLAAENAKRESTPTEEQAAPAADAEPAPDGPEKT